MAERIRYGEPGYPKRPFCAQHRARLFRSIGPGGHACHWCRRPISWDVDYPAEGALVVDHLDANRHNNDPANLVPSCQPCNHRRGVLARMMHEALWRRCGFSKLWYMSG